MCECPHSIYAKGVILCVVTRVIITEDTDGGIDRHVAADVSVVNFQDRDS